VPNPTTTNAALVRKIRLGRATLADLTAGGVTQLGTTRADYAPCSPNGQSCTNDIYAVSLPAVMPVDDAPPNALGAESFIGFRCAR